MTQEVDRKDLKIQALLEKVSSLTTNYENTAADLRVELTITVNDNARLKAENDQLRAEVEDLRGKDAEPQEDSEATDDTD